MWCCNSLLSPTYPAELQQQGWQRRAWKRHAMARPICNFHRPLPLCVPLRIQWVPLLFFSFGLPRFLGWLLQFRRCKTYDLFSLRSAWSRSRFCLYSSICYHLLRCCRLRCLRFLILWRRWLICRPSCFCIIDCCSLFVIFWLWTES